MFAVDKSISIYNQGWMYVDDVLLLIKNYVLDGFVKQGMR